MFNGFLLLLATYNISEKKKLFVDVARQIIVEDTKFETHSYGLQS